MQPYRLGTSTPVTRITQTRKKQFKTKSSYLLTYLLHLGKLTGLQLAKKFPAFYETRRFIKAFTSVRHLYLSLASSIQSIPHTPLREDPPQYYPPIYAWVSPVVSIPQVFPPKSCTRLSPPQSELHAPPISFLSILSPAQ
jgi:hypothetical protein